MDKHRVAWQNGGLLINNCVTNRLVLSENGVMSSPGGEALQPIQSALLILALLGSSSGVGNVRAAEPVDYARQVKPILKQRCYSCHGALKSKAGLRLDTGMSIRQGGDGGAAVEPGVAGESLLVDRVTEVDPAHRMPPEGTPLTAAQVGIIRDWIDQGAISPAEERPEADPRKHWSFSRPNRPAVPNVRDAVRVRNPIDSFLAKEYERLGLVPLPPAEPHVLLRRIYLDLTGLPPTRAELREFLADPSDAAYEGVVDRLLASPRYGERWARHWMDVWRYSDWYGRRAVPDVTNSYAQIWRWRDWIVRSLNEDKGYDRMVREMLAADEIAPTDAANLAATGFLVRNFYRWNYNLWMKDNVEHTGKAFLGLTFNCAHCHDHKYDPITHEDYFAFRAVFEPMELRHDRVPGEPDPGPYPKYDYGKAYPPITSGMVRIIDEKLEAQTFLYTRGESRNIVPNRPPIVPGMPAFLGGGSYRVVSVSLPAETYYPGLKPFIQQEEIKKRESALAGAERVLKTPHAANSVPLTLRIDGLQRDSALSELAALRARIAADQARYGKSGGDVGELRRAAARAERRATVDRLAVELARADRTLAAAKTEPEMQKAKKRRDAALKAHAAARIAVDQPSDEYTPLSPVYPSRSTGRRAALARWITGRANPLTARVAVNHIWRWHFGTALVATTHDFGRNGAAPSHPDLLDWLAVELMEPSAPGVSPWSLKALHRLIVTSSAYRMSSHPSGANEPGRVLDPENRRYWHFPTVRMEAEEVRDGLIHLTGGLDPAIGGPDIDFAQGLTSRRRSLYFTHHGEARMPFLEQFDAADPCEAYRRTTSIVPQQALALVNNEFLLDLSDSLASRLWSEAEASGSGCARAFLTAAFEQILTRPPSAREREVSEAFLAKQGGLLERAVGTGPLGSARDGDPRARARRDLIHALFSHNDFIMIH